MASIPKMNRTPSRSQRSRCLVWVNFGVAPVGDLAEPRPAAEGGGLVQVDVGVLVRGPVAAPVDQVQRLGGVGQRDDQRVIAPRPVVGDVHALLAPAVGGGERPVGVDERLVEEVLGLLLPGPQPGLVEDVHQLLDVGFGEAAAEVPGGGRVGDAFGPQGVEVDLVVAADFEVLQPAAAGQEVVGDVQDVVALVIRQVPLQEVEALVDVVGPARASGPGGGWPRSRRVRSPGPSRRSRSGCWRRPSSARGVRRRAGSRCGGGFSACVGSTGGGHWRSLESLLAANGRGV